MELMKRAIQDERNFVEFRRSVKLEKIAQGQYVGVIVESRASPRRRGENREQHRARLRTEPKDRA